MTGDEFAEKRSFHHGDTESTEFMEASFEILCALCVSVVQLR
jgi:hypothetical protein